MAKKHLKIPPPPGKSARKNPIGATISERFELRRLLGEGASGKVYEAVQLSVDRPVAIKVLQAEATEEVRERFTREARAIARLSHPNCITLHDFGYSNELDSLYMVTEFVRGRELFDVLYEDERSLPTVLRYMLQIGEALDHAHKNKILHRDLKPENVIVTKRGDVKVLDFGLARIMTEMRGPDARRLTAQGDIFGTPVYMSPEQCGGDLDVDERADVYALGVMLYETFEGEPPFDSDDMMQVLIAHIQAPVPPMTSDIPGPLRDLVMQMLEKDREARPPSAREVIERLQAILVDVVVEDAQLNPDVSQEIARSLLSPGLGASSSTDAELGSPSADAAGQWTERPATMDLLGATIGTYQVKRLLGTGTTGAVFQAVDPEGSRVALKVLSTKVDDGLRVGERFEREERALRAIDDPRVVRIFGAGYDKTIGRAFMAMEYVEGTSLHEVIRRRGSLPPPEALALAHEIALGLAAAHEAGAVHRDLKPMNIMLEDEDTSRPKILDFGLAFFGDDTRLTVVGEAVGSVSYMAPEVLLGKVPDERADIYALGLIIYEAVTGSRRYDGNAQSVAAKILSKRSEPLALSDDLPERVAALINTLCGDVETRPDSARKAATMIETVRAGEVGPSEADDGGRVRTPTAVGAWNIVDRNSGPEPETKKPASKHEPPPHPADTQDPVSLREPILLSQPRSPLEKDPVQVREQPPRVEEEAAPATTHGVPGEPTPRPPPPQPASPGRRRHDRPAVGEESSAASDPTIRRAPMTWLVVAAIVIAAIATILLVLTGT